MERITTRVIGAHQVVERCVNYETEEVKLNRTVWDMPDGIPVELIQEIFREQMENFGIREGVQQEWAQLVNRFNIRVLETCAKDNNRELSVYGEKGDEASIVQSWRGTYVKDGSDEVIISHTACFHYYYDRNRSLDKLPKHLNNTLKESCSQLDILEVDQIVSRVKDCVKTHQLHTGLIEIQKMGSEITLHIVSKGNLIQC